MQQVLNPYSMFSLLIPWLIECCELFLLKTCQAKCWGMLMLSVTLLMVMLCVVECDVQRREVVVQWLVHRSPQLSDWTSVSRDDCRIAFCYTFESLLQHKQFHLTPHIFFFFLLSVYLSHLCPLPKLFDQFRCHFASTRVGSSNTLF